MPAQLSDGTFCRARECWLMKTRITLVGLITVLFTFASTAAFGQAINIWTGGDGTGTDIGQATNWNGGLPSTVTGDIGEWNGTVPGNLSLVYDTSTLTSGLGQSGVNFYLNSAQTGSVTIGTTLTTSPSIGLYNITIDSGAGAFTF